MEASEGDEVLRAYWAAVARLERRIEELGSFGPPLPLVPGLEMGSRVGVR